MRILLVNQFFWPDTAATSQLLTDVARGLADLGHDVHVVCGSAGYSEMDHSEAPAVTIRRAPTLPFGRGKLARLMSYFSFFATATLRGLGSRRFDLVLTLTTPPLLSLMGSILKRTRGTRHFIWEMDVYPEIAVDLGVLSANGALTKLIGALADLTRDNADGVVVLGDCMRDRLLRRGTDPNRIHVAENWADGRTIEPRPLRPDGKLKVLYSGNLGLAHDVETIYGAMYGLRTDARFQFIFAGSGAERKQLQEKCESHGMNNVVFRGLCPRELLGQSLSDGDIGLVTQKSTCPGSVVPSKVYGLLAAGRPLLYIGPHDTTPAHIIQRYRCGWHIDNGDVDSLIDVLATLRSNPELVREAGHRARQAFLRHYDLPVGVARICSLLGAVAEVEPVRASSAA